MTRITERNQINLETHLIMKIKTSNENWKIKILNYSLLEELQIRIQ